VNRTGRTVVVVDVGLKREDWGLALGAVAAVVLIGGFLVVTGRSSEDADAGPSTTEAAGARSGLVRIGSDADPDLEWATARGTFRPECEDGRAVHVDAKVTRLPPDLRYGWRVITDEETLETAPLTARPGLGAELVQGDGLASAFQPTEAGKATVRFSFTTPRRDVVVHVALVVLDVPEEQSLVLAAPRLTCRGTAPED
jgi:hypothetical protein